MTGCMRSMLFPLVAAAGLSVTPAPLSDPIGIYGLIDKVILTPNATAPTAIQIWGMFTLSEGIPGDHYRPAARGYLYFSLNSNNERAVRAEWSDLQSLAGKREIVGFSTHYAKPAPRVRCATEAPAEPDDYTTNIGVVRGVNDVNMIAGDLKTDLSSGKAPAAPCRSRGG